MEKSEIIVVAFFFNLFYQQDPLSQTTWQDQCAKYCTLESANSGVVEGTSIFSQDIEETDLRKNWFPELIFFHHMTCGNPRNKFLATNRIFLFGFLTQSAMLSVHSRPYCSMTLT